MIARAAWLIYSVHSTFNIKRFFATSDINRKRSGDRFMDWDTGSFDDALIIFRVWPNGKNFTFNLLLTRRRVKNVATQSVCGRISLCGL